MRAEGCNYADWMGLHTEHAKHPSGEQGVPAQLGASKTHHVQISQTFISRACFPRAPSALKLAGPSMFPQQVANKNLPLQTAFDAQFQFSHQNECQAEFPFSARLWKNKAYLFCITFWFKLKGSSKLSGTHQKISASHLQHLLLWFSNNTHLLFQSCCFNAVAVTPLFITFFPHLWSLHFILCLDSGG